MPYKQAMVVVVIATEVTEFCCCIWLFWPKAI